MAQTPNPIPETYDGREQAIIKHRLLESYLLKLFMIVGAGRKNKSIELCYVDCFAGPWSGATDSLEGTSIAVSLNTLDQCRQKLGELGTNAKIRALYVEKDPTRYARLEAHLKARTPSGIRADPLLGDFVKLRQKILDWCGGNAFAFFFIDPKGWKDVGIETLRLMLQRPRSEFLINFAYMYVNRTISMADWQDRMVALLGKAIDLDSLAPEEREQRIVNAYRSSLKECLPSDYQARSAYVRVLDPNRNRPKYHLVYVTSHPRGVIEFMEISDHVDLVQKQVRATKQEQRRAQKTGIEDMFGAETLINPAKGHASAKDVDQYWIDYLRNGFRHIAAAEFADILEETNWFPSDLQASLIRLIASGRVVNLDAPRPRPKTPLHWKENDRLQLAEERR